LGIQDTQDQASLLDIPLQGLTMTHFTNADEREIFEAINLLKDDEREWSTELEAIRGNLARLLERIMQVEWHYLEPEIGDLSLNLLKEIERETNARRTNTTGEEIILQSENYLRVTGQQRPVHTCRCAGK
jgi:regulator of replication initiation timing